MSHKETIDEYNERVSKRILSNSDSPAQRHYMNEFYRTTKKLVNSFHSFIMTRVDTPHLTGLERLDFLQNLTLAISKSLFISAYIARYKLTSVDNIDDMLNDMRTLIEKHKSEVDKNEKRSE